MTLDEVPHSNGALLVRRSESLALLQAGGVYRATASLPAGYFEVYGGNTRCFTSSAQPFAVAAGHDRTITVALTTSVLRLVDHSVTPDALVVVLPLAGLDVSLSPRVRTHILQRVTVISGSIEAKVAYFDRLLPGSYWVAIGSAGLVTCIAANLPRGRRSHVVTLTITLGEIKRGFGAYHGRAYCPYPGT